MVSRSPPPSTPVLFCSFSHLTADTSPLHYCLGPARTPGESLASHRPHFKRNENTDHSVPSVSRYPPPPSPNTHTQPLTLLVLHYHPPPPIHPSLSSPSTSAAKQQRGGSHMDQSELPQWERALVISGLMSDGGLGAIWGVARQRLSSPSWRKGARDGVSWGGQGRRGMSPVCRGRAAAPVF